MGRVESYHPRGKPSALRFLGPDSRAALSRCFEDIMEGNCNIRQRRIMAKMSPNLVYCNLAEYQLTRRTTQGLCLWAVIPRIPSYETYLNFCLLTAFFAEEHRIVFDSDEGLSAIEVKSSSSCGDRGAVWVQIIALKACCIKRAIYIVDVISQIESYVGQRRLFDDSPTQVAERAGFQGVPV